MDERKTDIRNPVLDLLTQLRMALGQLRLYPANTPQAQKAIVPALAAVAAFPGAQGRITLSRTMRGLLVNGKRPPAGDASAVAEKAWLQVLQDGQVNSIAILTSVGLEELTTFIDALGRKFWDLKEGKAINARLREKGVLQAWVEEVEFVAMSKGDLLIEGAAGKLEAAGARVSEIVQTLEQVIDGTASEGLGEQVRLEIVRKLLEQDPLLIQKAQAMTFAMNEDVKEGGGSGDGTGAGAGTGTGAGGRGGRWTLLGSGKAPGWISFDQARKGLTEIAKLLAQADGAHRDALRALGHMLLGGFRHDPLLLELLKKFLTDEAIDLMPAWMLEEKKEKAAPEGPPSPDRRAAAILALSEDARIDALGAEAVALVKDLTGLKRPDLVGDMVKAAVEHARHISAGHRLKGTRLLGQLYPLMEAEELKDARAAIEGRVMTALDLERDRAIYPGLVELAAAAAESRVIGGALEAAAPILEALRRQQTEDKEYPERREISFRGIERVAVGKAFPAVLEQLRAKHPAAVRTAEALGFAAAKGLIGRMEASDSMAERIGLAHLLLRAGPEAGNLLTAQLQQVLAPSVALKLLDLLRLAMPEGQAEAALGATLRHPALAVRRRAAAFLKGGSSPRAGSYFLEALKKEVDPSARALFVECLGALRNEAALPVLGQILEARSEADDVRAAAAAALGGLGKPQAIPILTRACTRSRGITAILNSTPTPVRAAAVRALAAYAHFPECRESLRRSLEDPEAVVRDAARESLTSPMGKAFGEEARKASLVFDGEQLAGFSEKGVAGFLSELPLDQVCQSLEEGNRTGLLLLNVGGSNAQIHLERGGVVSAEYNGLKGQEAFNQFCRWEGAYFLFTPGVAVPNPGPAQNLIKMVMDACEIRDKPSPSRP